MASFPVTMNKGDILRVNGINMPIRNQITLKRDELGEYYEIDFVKLKVMIDKEKIYEYLIIFNKIRKEFRNEKLLILFILNFFLIRSDVTLENISFM